MESLHVTESLFAVDTTLLGNEPEIDRARNTTVETLKRFGEKNHPDKEHMLLGEEKDIRILGFTLIGKFDLKIEKISRQTNGHLQRMGNQKGVLGWPSELEEVKAKAVKHTLNTGENYKTRARILTIEMQALNREARKTFVNERAAYIQKWEETQAEQGDTKMST